MEKRTFYSIGITIVVLAAIIVPKVMSSSGPVKENANASKEIITPIKVYVVKNEKLSDRILTNGTVMSNEEVELRAETSGKITKIFFTEGSVVSKNQLLVKINDSELKAQLTKASFSRKLAEEKELRQRQLKEKNAISQQEYDISLNELNTFQADEDLIKARIEKTEIRAPFDGVIGLKNVSEGNFISSDKVIANLQDLTPLKIDFSVPEKYAHQIRKGIVIQFKVQGVSGVMDGTIYAIEPRINAATRTLQLRAIYPNANSKILPGAFADIELIMSESDKEITAPTQALIPELNGQKLFLYKSGKVVPKMVETGIRTTDRIQITKGISIGDTIITTGILQIRPGMSVRISE